MVVPEGIVAAGAESAIATPEKQNPAIKSATSLMVNRRLPHFINKSQPPRSTGQLDWRSDIAVHDTRVEQSRKGGKFECVAMDRGI
jgi:hypothetical protein